MTEPTAASQLSVTVAEIYESRFVPSVFAGWARALVDAADVGPGDAVLDVGCGTGIVARTVADRVPGHGWIVGVDISDGMLSVARRLQPDVEWQQGDATRLLYADEAFDVVLSQAMLMFVPAPMDAVREMARVAKEGGTVAVHVWASLSQQRGWGPFHEAIRRHAGPEALDMVSGYWRMGNREAVVKMCTRAGLRVKQASTVERDAVYRSVEQFVTTEIAGTPLEAALDPGALQHIMEDTAAGLTRFQRPDGRLAVPLAGHIVVCRK
ncbi:methyltransferase domain-containing protein [Brevibacterium daeguense]|uniref:Methyltransferase domain-containing protein n=1 Tax=Brevibacterium daeguense TaxID=909936 RepID=A0ABP8EKN3_9MICO|nr:methyltransferase domain-containing protein [Brevibacterium daeguense]